MNNEIELFDWENLTILKNFNKNLHSIISTDINFDLNIKKNKLNQFLNLLLANVYPKIN